MAPSRWITVVAMLGVSGCGARPAPPPPPPPPAVATAPGWRIPPDSEIPNDHVGAAIRRGRAILTATRDSLPGYVGNNLRCTSCHLDAGTRQDAAPWVGVYSRFPQYRSRNGKINVIQDRINDCFQRSLAGKALEPGGRDIADIIAYMAFLSRGVAPPGDVPGQGFKMMTPVKPDTANGKLVFASQCARCHGGRGEGMDNPDPDGQPRYYPPLWGPRSYTIGAGMARLRTAAAFISRQMPYDRPGTLTDQEAFDVAAYVNSNERPDFGPKAADWPNGDPPPDVAYPTRAASNKRR
jgi:thiosulfate dehydrogenase